MCLCMFLFDSGLLLESGYHQGMLFQTAIAMLEVVADGCWFLWVGVCRWDCQMLRFDRDVSVELQALVLQALGSVVQAPATPWLF